MGKKKGKKGKSKDTAQESSGAQEQIAAGSSSQQAEPVSSQQQQPSQRVSTQQQQTSERRHAQQPSDEGVSSQPRGYGRGRVVGAQQQQLSQRASTKQQQAYERRPDSQQPSVPGVSRGGRGFDDDGGGRGQVLSGGEQQPQLRGQLQPQRPQSRPPPLQFGPPQPQHPQAVSSPSRQTQPPFRQPQPQQPRVVSSPPRQTTPPYGQPQPQQAWAVSGPPRQTPSPLGQPQQQRGAWGQPRQPPQVSPQQFPQHVQIPWGQQGRHPSMGPPGLSQQATGMPLDSPHPVPQLSQQLPSGQQETVRSTGTPQQRKGPSGHQISSPQSPPGFIQQGEMLQTPPSIPQQPPQYMPPVQQQQLVTPGGQADVPGSGPTPISAQKQQPQKGQKKGKQKIPRQQEPEQRASTSLEKTTSELSQMKISKTEAGQGDIQILPMDYIRAKPGTAGKTIRVEANYLRLNLGALDEAAHYDVTINPDRFRKYYRQVMELFRKKHYKDHHPAFDGRKNLYSPRLLPFGDHIESDITLKDSNGSEIKYHVTVKLANMVDLTLLHDIRNAGDTPREALQVVDIVLRSAPADRCIASGRSFFLKPPRMIDLQDGMQMYSGFYQSAVRAWVPLLNVDVVNRAFTKNLSVIELLLELVKQLPRNDLHRPLRSEYVNTLSTFLNTLKVSYEIPGQPLTKKVYGVNAVDSTPARDKTFTLDTGRSITIENYYKTEKNYKLNFPNLPTLWVGSKQKNILLPLELCTLVESQTIRKKMTDTQTSIMIKHATRNTKMRKERIMTALHSAAHNSDPSVRGFGFSISNQFEKLDARVLGPPLLQYRNSNVMPSRGTWNGDTFLTGGKLEKWTIISVHWASLDLGLFNQFASLIVKHGAYSGMQISNPRRPFQNQIQCRSVKDMVNYFQQPNNRDYDVIFVIVPDKGREYSYVKTASEINVGCLTQCIRAQTLNKMSKSTVINILLKVNSKLNGTNHCLAATNLPPIMEKPCIIMGADVTHPGPTISHIPSVAAVTASQNITATSYNICWRLQPPKVEIIEDLEAIVREQLMRFYQVSRIKPEKIIFFRDGVSEGQFEQVRSSEIRAIRSACKKLQADGSYKPPITFLVVQKRHHTRLFPQNEADSEDRNGNVPAGTCVDSHITHPFMQDFYLVSHASIQGVARPTKYCTLWDDNKLSNDTIEQLTYFLCHLFARCNRSVSYPAPTYYAHLAAARAKVYIENENLNMDQLPSEYQRFQILDVIRKGKPMFFV